MAKPQSTTPLASAPAPASTLSLRPAQAAKALAISVRTLARWRERGIVRAVTIGGVVLYRPEDLAAALANAANGGEA